MATKNRITTPAGRAVWPHLHAPDAKFNNKPWGIFDTKLNLEPSPETTAFIEQIDELTAQAMAMAKKKAKGKKVQEYLCYDEMEDGGYQVRAKSNAGGRREDGSEWTRNLPIFDATGTPLKDAPKIGGGSLLKLSVEPYQFYNAAVGNAGVSLRLEAVQVLELQEFGGGSADSYGFGEEDGFTADDLEDTVDNPFDGEDEFADDADDDDDTEVPDADF